MAEVITKAPPPYSDPRAFDPPPETSWGKLLALVPQGARVLDVGCAYGGFASAMRRLRGCRVTGVEIDPESAAAARAHCDEVFEGDVVDVAQRLPADFDVIIAADVLEHLVDPEAAVRLLSSRLREGGVLLASIPNVTHLSVVLALAEGRFPRSREGLLDQTHVRFFGEEDVLALFHSAGLAARIADKVRTEPASTEFHTDVRALPLPVLEYLERNPNADTYQFIVRAIPRAWAATGDDQEVSPPLLEGGGIAGILQQEAQQIRREWEERGRWGQSLQADLEKARKDLEQLQKEFLVRTAWAESAAAEAAQGHQERARLEQRLAELQLQLQATPAAMMRRIARRTTKEAAAMSIAALAVPVAAGVGAAAVLMDALGRVLPKRPFQVRPALGPRLATIQILNYEGKELLERNLPSVLAAVSQTGQPHEVLVVDNGSTDGSVEMLREKFPDVKVVALDRNYYFSRGNNAGVPHASHGILVLLNNDMRVEPDFLAPLLAPFDDPDVFAVSSQIFFPPGPKRREETGLTRARFVEGMMQYSHDPVPDPSGELIPILWGGGGSCAFDRSKWEALGGLDVMYDPFYCEDLDLSLRAWQRGWKVYLAPSSKVWHEHRATSRRFFTDEFVSEIFRRNSFLLHWKNLRDPRLLASHLVQLPSLVARDVRLHGRSGVRSFLKAIKHAPDALLGRLQRPSNGASERATLQDTELARPDVLFREPKRLRDGAPLRITIVTPYHFWPIQHGGAVRMYHAARALAARGHEVSVVGFVDNDEQRQSAAHLSEFCAEVRLLVRQARPPPPHFGAIPDAMREFDRPELHRELNSMIARRDPDVIQVEYTHLAPYGRKWPRAAVCLTEHDISFVSLYRQAALETDRSTRRLLHLRYLQMFRYELEVLRRFDVVFTVSDKDAAILGSYLRNDVRLSPAGRIGVHVAPFAGLIRKPDRDRLLFIGYFQHRPNVDAMLWFAREVLPLVHARNPAVRLDVVGAAAPPDVQALAQDPRIRVHGFVPDLGSHYESAALSISPVRMGSGVRVKLLEAFAAGVPVVCTRVAAEGLDVRDGDQLALADEPQEFADRVLALLDAPAEAEGMAERARRFVLDRYSWAQIGEELESEYRRALRRKGLVK